ncbi:MAG TPA: hypothetical protein VIR16_09745, partial [Candidatus Limnocylindrales bacterium]
EVVIAHGGPIDRDAAAAAAGIGRPLAAFHLDRLVESGLLEVEFRRRSGRTGPGAGRPAKFYLRASGPDIAVSLPPRHYDLAARILADAVDSQPQSAQAVVDAAAREGVRIGRMAQGSAPYSLVDLLERQGYEPVAEPDGTIRLRNCPFHALVGEHLELTCSMNRALLEGVLATTTDTRLVAESQPREGFCCVAFVPEPDPA